MYTSNMEKYRKKKLQILYKKFEEPIKSVIKFLKKLLKTYRTIQFKSFASI